MPILGKKIWIDAPVSRVFDYLDNPENLPDVWPSLLKVSNVVRSPNGGASFQWTYRMSGMEFDGSSSTTEHLRNHRCVVKSQTGIESTTILTFQARAGGTDLRLEATFLVPLPLQGRVAEALLAQDGEAEVTLFLSNVKAKLETSKE